MPKAAFVAALVAFAPLARAAENLPPCPASPSPGRIPAGETLEFAMDVMGAQIGTLTLATLRSQGDGGSIVRAHMQTGAFAANFRTVDDHVEAKFDAGLRAVAYHELNEEDGVRRTIDFTYPKDGPLEARATKDGNPASFDLKGPPTARDYVSALYALRGRELALGGDVCLDVYGAWRTWRVTGKVAAREKVRSPAGDWDALRIDGSAVRFDDPASKTEVHLWITDDLRRLPVAAFGTARGKPVRVLLTKLTEPARRR